MDFASFEHEQFYSDNQSITMNGDNYKALIYTLGIDEICRKHFSSIYDYKEDCIIPDVLFEDWQTDSSRTITRIAFNLFLCSTQAENNPVRYVSKDTLSSLDHIHSIGVLLALIYFA